MNLVYNNYYQMLLSVKKFLGDNSSVIAEKPAFNRAVNRLNEKIASIRALDEKRGERGSGITGTKSQIKETLMESILKIAGAIKAYASENNKPDLVKKGKISKSGLVRLRELDLCQRAETIHDLARLNSAALAEYGINSADLNALIDLNNTFSDLIGEVGKKQGERAGETKNLDALFDEVKVILEDQVDGLAATLKKDNPSFYNQYKSVRVISDRGGHRWNGANGSDAPPQA
jgi:hypothetical protein